MNTNHDIILHFMRYDSGALKNIRSYAWSFACYWMDRDEDNHQYANRHLKVIRAIEDELSDWTDESFCPVI